MVYDRPVPLNERQLAAIPVLDWLLGQSEADRRSGRSWVTAVALVRRAARETHAPGLYWTYQDHLPEIPRTQQWDVIGPLVQNLIAGDRRLSPHVTYRRDSFRLQLPEPIDDWLPQEFLLEADYAALEMQMMAGLGLTPEQLRGVQENPHQGTADEITQALRAIPRESASRENFALIYGEHPTGRRDGLRRVRRGHDAATSMGSSAMACDDLASSAGKHWIDGREVGSMRLQVLKSRGDPPPPPPTAWDRIMADEDAF